MNFCSIGLFLSIIIFLLSALAFKYYKSDGPNICTFFYAVLLGWTAALLVAAGNSNVHYGVKLTLAVLYVNFLHF